jgi:hypothetical protein
MGATCLLGTCVDLSCGSASGGECFYRGDCCKNLHCLEATEPDPECPETCPMPFPAIIRPDLCLCLPGGGCADLGRDAPDF